MTTAGDGGAGRLIQSRYRLDEVIGRGGMGEVWRALDESLGRNVAVKCLKPLGPAADRDAAAVIRERFRREARVAAALQHRGVTVVHDFGESDGLLYIVMELLDGRNLSQLLEDNRGHPLPVPDVLDIAEQVIAALDYTHAKGIIHRDLKPANIIRLSDGTVKLCDFGIVRLGHDAGATSRLTATGIAMGTPHYMSPEQIGGPADVDHRSDLYSLGCVLYEVATGSPPFDLDDTWAVLIGHRDTEPVPLRTQRPGLPEELERLVLDLLAKNPEDRPQSAADVGGRLKTMRADPARSASGHTDRLPSWAHGVTTGSGGRADRPGAALRAVPALTGAWSSRPDPAVASQTTQAALAGRHDAAVGLGRIGGWQEAVEAHRAVGAARERMLGRDHPDTLASRHETAVCLGRLNRMGEALRMYGEVGAARQRVLGPDHPDTLMSRQEEAYVLGRMGRHLEAHQGYTAVLAARGRTVGGEHPDTLRCRHNLACNLGRLGRLDEALAMARSVSGDRARVLGADHPDTLVTRFETGHALGRLGRWEQALGEYREVAALRARTFGGEHPDTLAVRYEMGICLGRLGRGEQALELYRGLVAARTRTAGGTDPETLRARHGLGVNLGRTGHWEEALAEARDVAALRELVLGAEHPETLVSKREIAVGLGWLSRWEPALAVYREVSRARDKVLGAEHPNTLASRNDEAHCLERLGRSDEALTLYRNVAALQQLGPQRI